MCVRRVRVVTRRDFVLAKCAAGLVFELLGDLTEALKAMSSAADGGAGAGDVDADIVSDVQVMLEFLRSQAAVISRRPLLLMQQAMNQPERSPIYRLLPYPDDDLASASSVSLSPQYLALRVDMPKAPERCVASLVGHSNWVRHVSMWHAPETLLTAAMDGTVRCWNSKTAAELWVRRSGGVPVPVLVPARVLVGVCV